jgi:hypothetical protein
MSKRELPVVEVFTRDNCRAVYGSDNEVEIAEFLEAYEGTDYETRVVRYVPAEEVEHLRAAAALVRSHCRIEGGSYTAERFEMEAVEDWLKRDRELGGKEGG